MVASTLHYYVATCKKTPTRTHVHTQKAPHANPLNKTIVRLNDAAMTLATMLISRDEYKTRRAAERVCCVGVVRF